MTAHLVRKMKCLELLFCSSVSQKVHLDSIQTVYMDRIDNFKSRETAAPFYKDFI